MEKLTSTRAARLLDGMARLKILVIGDLMLDVYLRGGASRISPEAPVPVVRVDDEWRALGGAGNVAANLAALGAAVELAGVLGADREGDAFRSLCQDRGIGMAGVLADQSRPTTTKTRVLVGYQQVARYDREAEDDLAPHHAGTLRAHVETLAAQADAIVLGDYDKGVLIPTVIRAAIEAARARSIPVVVDPKARGFFDYAGCTVFKPNLSELAAALRAPVQADDFKWLDQTRRRLECDHLLVTLGADGMVLVSAQDGQPLRVPAIARSVYDVSGAGDTVAAVMAAALAAGATAAEAAILATHAAGIEVGKAGVATVAPDEILASIRDLPSSVLDNGNQKRTREHDMSALQRIHTEAAPAAIGPYSQAIRLGDFVFTAGQIPLDPGSMEMAGGEDVAAQTERVMMNLAAILEAAGAGLETVVKTTVYLADMGDFAAMNDVYGRFFGEHRPARSTVEVRRLPRDARVEIDAIARVL